MLQVQRLVRRFDDEARLVERVGQAPYREGGRFEYVDFEGSVLDVVRDALVPVGELFAHEKTVREGRFLQRRFRYERRVGEEPRPRPVDLECREAPEQLLVRHQHDHGSRALLECLVPRIHAAAALAMADVGRRGPCLGVDPFPAARFQGFAVLTNRLFQPFPVFAPPDVFPVEEFDPPFDVLYEFLGLRIGSRFPERTPLRDARFCKGVELASEDDERHRGAGDGLLQVLVDRIQVAPFRGEVDERQRLAFPCRDMGDGLVRKGPALPGPGGRRVDVNFPRRFACRVIDQRFP